MNNEVKLTDKTSPKEIAAFAIYGGGNGIFNYMLNSFGTYFYTNIVGIDALVAGFFMTILKVVDFVTDFLMGTIIDHTNHKSGEKARPWLAKAMVPGSIGLILMFSAPFANGSTASVVWAVATYFIATSICFTMNLIPYQAMMPLVSGNRVNRSKLECAYGVIAMVISLVAGICVEPLATALGGGKKGWFLTAVILAIVALILHIIGYLGTKEHVRLETPPKRKRDKAEVAREIGYLFRNKYWVLTMLLTVITSLSTMAQSMMYYVQYVMGDFSVLAYVMIVMMVPSMVMLVIAPMIVKRFGKAMVIRVGAIAMLAGAIIVWCFGAAWSFYTGMVILSFGAGGATATMISFLGDAIDFGEYKFGVRSSGVGVSLAVSLQKIAQACAALILGAILTAGGYDAEAMVQSDSGVFAIKIAFCGVPIIIAACTFVISLLLNIEKKYPDLPEKLLEIRAQKASGEGRA
ncbi:MAG: glycoside-pentoside-hexuronide (GPH):cation symporter [Parasporobacterium sp.]|nr:glycoside-pentoside-hexuronide (GPH):cation symporter [Parasporobacterium sp.]